MGNYKLLPTQIFYNRRCILVMILILNSIGMIKCENSITDEDLYKFTENQSDDMPMDNVWLKNENLIEEEDNQCQKTRLVKRQARLCGERKLPYTYNKTKAEIETLISELPEEYDLRNKSDICPSLTEISDQGNCNSCWAVAPTDVMTDRLCLRSKGKNKTRYSAADLLSCCPYCKNKYLKNADSKPLRGSCQVGGFHEKAWPYWVEYGLVSGYYDSNAIGGCRNYNVDRCSHKKTEPNNTVSQNKCSLELTACPTNSTKNNGPTCDGDENNQKCENNTLQYKDDKRKGKNCYFIKRLFDGKESAIKLEIQLNGPVHGIFTVYESFYKLFSENNHPSEVQPYLGQNETDNLCPVGSRTHSIRIVGWGKTSNKTNYWIAANSWGKKWGNNGFFHLHFDHDKPKENEKTWKDRVFAGIPKLTL